MKLLNTLTVVEARTGLDAKDFTSLELTQACLAAIKQKEPSLNAFVTVFEDEALKQASLADQILQSSPATADQPLLGIPIALKDNFLTKNQRTTASSKVLDQFSPQYDATVTKRLKDAGAIILGKANMDAWAHGSSTETSDYGPTTNPYSSEHLAGGSSGGSAACVGADEVIAAIGSETAGSVRQPASWCGVVGFKPTYGRVSRYGAIAMGSSLDSPGPLTKSVTDAAIITQVLAGHDPHDATTSSSPVPDYPSLLKTDVKGLKIGLPREYFMSETMPGINELVKDAAHVLESNGAELVEISLMDPKYSIADYTILQRSEVSSNLARYDGIRFGNDRTHFASEAKRRIMLGTYALSSGYYDAYYKRAQQVRMLLKRDFDQVFDSVDLILAPTNPSTALQVGDTLNQAMFGELSDLLLEASSLVGLTGINMPVGFLNNLPVGMQLVAPQFQEQLVFNSALAYEQATNWKEISYDK
jgi:aspartyl-tRNA(Asn)/glutamyl-tRNA(Gln) amidotransferase subunit A